MISFNYELDFTLVDEDKYTSWIEAILESEGFIEGEINYIFCTDEYLHKINVDYLDHDTYTDIISFDYTEGKIISGDIFISIDRVKENALELGVLFSEELLRVMSHGILHYCGYLDKSEAEELLMRSKEDEKIKLFHVEQ
ncbi:rRNA maturation RNase YbeY [Myroides guanonis]|uniref:Endoribonuclease YbeY n=1 Tax=Myroides guanonis TaxID=1150112 RepID=A0A1I3RNI0_9FLAO|nr:rRNA maturation RNase YbeY [Myroides guanonis]SFJ48113.1 rRNA maturation RNase YbeY [Myroides guanonis]